MSSRVLKEFMNISGNRAPKVLRAESTWVAMMSRKDLPSRTSSSDLARSRPIEVPSPPLSLMMTVLSRASAACSSLTSTSSSIGGFVSGEMVSSRMSPVSPVSSWW